MNANVTYHRSGYTVSVSVTRHPERPGAVRLAVTTAHTHETYPDEYGAIRAENAMLWVDGGFVADTYGGRERWVEDFATRTTKTTFAVPLDRSRRNQCHLTLWTRDSKGPPVCEIDIPPLRPPLAGQILRTAFHASEEVFGAGSLGTLKAAGFNAVTISAFRNPADRAERDVTTFERWRGWWESLVPPQVRRAGEAGLKVLLTGDDFFRTAAEREWLDTCPWAADAVRHTAATLETLAECVGLELIDEVVPLASDTLTPKFLGWWEGACLIPVSFPYTGIAADQPNTRPWEQRAEYLSRYSRGGGAGGVWRDYGGELGVTGWQLWEESKRQGAATMGKPWIASASCCGPFWKFGEAYKQPGQHPSSIVAHPWLLLALGCSGFRYYALDTAWWQWERDHVTNPGSELQTGARPGDGRFEAVAAAFRSVAARESLLCQPALPPRDEFPWVYGARPGLEWAVNVSDGVEFAPFAGRLVSPTGGRERTVRRGAAVPAGGVVLSA